MTPYGSSGSESIGVVPSDFSSTTLQTVQTIASSALTSVGLLEDITLAGTAVSAATPTGILYLAPDSSGDIQLWGLPLTGANVPAPAQLGALSAPATATQCATAHAGANGLQTATAFVIIQYAVSPNTCTSGATTVLINWSDSSSTAPTSVPLSSAKVGALYLMPSGQLYGLTGIDTSGNLDLYAAGAGGTPSFASPVQIAAGVSDVSRHTIAANRAGQVVDSVSFEAAYFAGTSPAQIFRVDTTGSHGSIYTAAGALDTSCGCYDNTNFYFLDQVTSGNNVTTYNVYAAPIAGGTPTLVYSVTPPVDTSYVLLDSDGTSLVIESLDPGTATTTLYRVAVSGPSTQTPTQLLQVSGQTLSTYLDYSTDNLFVNEFSSSTGVHTALVLRPSGSSPSTPVAGPTASTAYLGGVSFGTNWLAFVNLPTNGTEGGASLELISNSDLSTGTPVTCPSCGGGTYSVPSGGTLTGGAISATFSTGIALAPGSISFASAPELGVLIDLQSEELEVLSVANTNVTPLL